MNNLVNWIKNNKVLVILSLVIAYILFTQTTFSLPITKRVFDTYQAADVVSFQGAPEVNMMYSTKSVAMPTMGVAPFMDPSVRKVVTESNVSLLVKDVPQTVKQISAEVEAKRGYVVNTYVYSPQESSTGYVTVRVPSSELNDFLDKMRALSIRVVSENISGTDVTDQYVNIQERLNILDKNKTVYDNMLAKATNVDDILRIQQAIFSVQDQIDSYQGQLKYIEATSASSVITINLSTDELSLPYAPKDPWRPSVIFKHAVRSLVEFGRFLGTAAIWVAVYSIMWIPVLAIFIWWKRRRKL